MSDFTSLYDTLFLRMGNVGIGTEEPHYSMDIAAGEMRVADVLGLGHDMAMAHISYDETSNILRCRDTLNCNIYLDQGFIAKGDILVYDGITQVRLPIGQDAQVLSVNNATNTGLMWKDVTSVGIGTNLTLTELSVEKINALSQNINLSTKSLSNLNSVSLNNLTSDLANVNISTKSISNISTVSLASITSDALNINISGKTLSNIASVQATNIIYKEEPTILSVEHLKIPYTTYYKTLTWLYEGTSPFVRLPTQLILNSYLHTTCNLIEYLIDPEFIYSTRLVDVTHNTVLSQANFSNSIPTTNTLSIINVPHSNIEIELQVRKGAKGTYVSIDGVTVMYT
jgi:hypothetical protein